MNKISILGMNIQRIKTLPKYSEILLYPTLFSNILIYFFKLDNTVN